MHTSLWPQSELVLFVSLSHGTLGGGALLDVDADGWREIRGAQTYFISGVHTFKLVNFVCR